MVRRIAIIGLLVCAVLYGAGKKGKPISCERMFWTRGLILSALQGLHERGVPLASAKLAKDKSPQTKNALKEILGTATSGTALHGASGKYFGTYPKALEEAGIEFNEISTRSKYTKEKVLRAIQALWKARVNLQPRVISLDNSQFTRRTIKDATGLNASGHLLFRKAIGYYGTFRVALREAGVDPSTQNVRLSRDSNTARLLTEYIEDDRLRLMSKRTGPYEELRFSELTELLSACLEGLEEEKQEQAYTFLEGAILEGKTDPEWSEYFSECLGHAHLDF